MVSWTLRRMRSCGGALFAETTAQLETGKVLRWDGRSVPDSVIEQLANHVLDCRGEFDEQLVHARRFPSEEFDRLWEAVRSYAAAIGGRELIHRAVASEISGLREYLELEIFRTPGEILARADRMECMLFTGHDPYFEGDEPPGL